MLIRLSIIINIRHLVFFFLKKIALELVSKSEECVGYSNVVFFFSSKGGGLRLILNCSLACPSYQDENSQLKQFKDISLKDEHYHVLVHQHRRQFPRFCFQENHYQFKVLPFGLDIAQRVFTKLMAVSDKYLRPRQIHIYTCTCMYLDD